jgi:hypothetical protein
MNGDKGKIFISVVYKGRGDPNFGPERSKWS